MPVTKSIFNHMAKMTVIDYNFFKTSSSKIVQMMLN